MPSSDFLRSRLRHFMHLMRSTSEKQQGRDSSSGQGKVLTLLAAHSPVSQKDLASALGIRSQSLAQLLTKMEDKALVRREPDPADRRTSVVSLTDQGAVTAREVEQRKHHEVDPFAVLNEEEKKHLDRILAKLIAGVESTMSSADFPPPPLQWPPPAPPGKKWAPPPPPASPPNGR